MAASSLATTITIGQLQKGIAAVVPELESTEYGVHGSVERTKSKRTWNLGTVYEGKRLKVISQAFEKQATWHGIESCVASVEENLF